MKRNEEVMEILEAFDLTQSFEAAARLAGCDPGTVARYVALRDRGLGPHDAAARDSVIDRLEPRIGKNLPWHKQLGRYIQTCCRTPTRTMPPQPKYRALDRSQSQVRRSIC
jgi:hypothetical protein